MGVVAQVPSPKSVLGFNPGDDRTIADWHQISDYFGKLDKASNRVSVRQIGKTTNGKPLIVAFISSPDNIKNLEKYRRISAQLADPRTIANDHELNELVRTGKTIVSISCSIHSTEIVASQMSMNLAYELASSNDSDTKEILDNTILLLIPSSNPDGIDIVADWYRKTIGTPSEGTSPPELYHHYAGHDDNRDWFMLNLPETQAITKLFWKEWYPQLVYDVHQQESNASRFIIPPFFDPVNPRILPSILREVGLIGYKMATDLQAKGVRGVATNSTYDTWWHGGFRSAPYYHNSIGILSEAASANIMSPVTVKREDLARNRNTRGLNDLLSPATNFPDVWPGGDWHPRDINDIEMTASRSLLQMAAKFRDRYLMNFYEYGRKNLIRKLDEPLAFVVPAETSNRETVSRLIEILIAQGIEVHKLDGTVGVKTAPTQPAFEKLAGPGFVIFVNQPSGRNVLSLFEKQEYPHRLLPNGEAEVPYDVAGWTLPLQMGVDYKTVWQIDDPDRERGRLKVLENVNDARAALGLVPTTAPFARIADPLKTAPRIGLYKSYRASIDEGWTRFVFDTFQIPYSSLMDAQVRAGNLPFDTIILPSASSESIMSGLGADRYPSEYAGGIGESGMENLRRFVERGGKLVCFDNSCDLVIKRFNLPIRNVLAGLKRSEFYDPGSIVLLNVDKDSRIARNMPTDVPAYFTNSSAYEITDDRRVRSIARYAAHDGLLSGWTLGEKYRAGKVALAEADYGKGSVVLFGFRPQHRAQSWATFPLMFNSLEK